MTGDLESKLQRIYRENRVVVLPLMFFSWVLLLVLLLFSWLFLVVVPVLFFLSARTVQNIRFASDRSAVIFTGGANYSEMQYLFHEHFEHKKPLRIMYCIGFNPWYRCRSAVLSKWKHREMRKR